MGGERIKWRKINVRKGSFYEKENEKDKHERSRYAAMNKQRKKK